MNERQDKVQISKRAEDFPESPIRKLNPLADRAKDQGVHVYHVNIGQPDIPTPDEFMEGVYGAEIDVLSYSPSQGERKTREALASYYRDHDIEVTPEQLMVTTGGSEAGLFAFYVTLEAGEEVLIPEPFYTNYRGFARMTGVDIQPIPTRKSDNFRLPGSETIEKLITEDTGALLLTNPSNPTGRVYSEEELSLAGDLARRHDLFLITDEVYREFVYGTGKARSSLEMEDMVERTVMIDSISKRLSGCGARIGTLVSKNDKVMESALKLGQSRLSPPTMGQLGLTNYLNSPAYPSAIREMIDRYEKRRDVLVEGLSKIDGIDYGEPEGAFYIMVGLPVENAERFVRWMLTDFRDDGETVMMAPGEGFYQTPRKGEDQVRLSYVLNREELARVGELLKKGLTRYGDMEKT
ncbi:MAG: pyridoxal phosphate-dependent aminotransferase [Candidatus Bipolaricaulota bacterium]